MRYTFLVLLILVSCLSSYTAQPKDLVKPGPIMCEPLNADVYNCRDANEAFWRCNNIDGRWYCAKVHD